MEGADATAFLFFAIFPLAFAIAYTASVHAQDIFVTPVPNAPFTAVISLKAIYEIKPTPEGTKAKVWSGRVESKSYEFNLRHW